MSNATPWQRMIQETIKQMPTRRPRPSQPAPLPLGEPLIRGLLSALSASRLEAVTVPVRRTDGRRMSG